MLSSSYSAEQSLDLEPWVSYNREPVEILLLFCIPTFGFLKRFFFLKGTCNIMSYIIVHPERILLDPVWGWVLGMVILKLLCFCVCFKWHRGKEHSYFKEKIQDKSFQIWSRFFFFCVISLNSLSLKLLHCAFISLLLSKIMLIY